MCAKMKTYFLVLSALCAALFIKCDEVSHHIDGRILVAQNETESNTISTDDTQINSTTSLENSLTTENSQQASTGSPIQTSTKFNVTSLLRKKEKQFGNQQVVPLSSDQNDAIDAEVKDLLDEGSPLKPQILEHQHPLEAVEPIQIPDKIDKQVELIEDGENTEDILRSHKEDSLKTQWDNEPVDKLEEMPNPTPVAIIFVTMFVVLSVLCYAGLLVYRKYLESRYGSRTLLVDADELAHPNDIRHFTI